MISVKNNQTGEIENLEDDKELPSLVESGAVSIPNQDYEFESPEGEKYKVGPQGFLDAVKMGWKYRDQGTIHEEKLQEKYGDSTAKALLYSGLSSTTAGISDLILSRYGLVNQEELSNVKKFNPVASTVGEVGGAIIPALLSGGAGVAGKAIVAREMAKGLSREAAEEIAKKAGSSILNKVTAYTPSSLLVNSAEIAGVQASKRAAQNITSGVAKAAVNLGAAGTIEGAGQGFIQTVSEAALGDAEFNAEALLSNVGTGALVGAGIGAGIGAGSEYLKKATKGVWKSTKDKIAKDMGISDDVRRQWDGDDAIEAATSAFSENGEIVAAAERQGLKAPPGVTSNNFVVKGAQESLEESPSLAGTLVRAETQPFKEGLKKGVEEVTEKASQLDPYFAGQEGKRIITQGVNERLRPAQEGLRTVFDTFGNFDVRERMTKMLGNRIAKSDLYKLSLDKGLVEGIQSTLANVTTLNQANMFKKQIGKQLAAEFKKPDRNMAVIDILEDVYGTLGKLERRAIEDASLTLGPKTGPKASKEALKIYDESMQRYRDIYKDYLPVADSLGVKLKSPDVFLDTIEGIESERFTKKLLSLTDYDSAKALKKSHPELFDVARKQKLADFKNQVTDPASGEISLKKFSSRIEKMTPQEREILFGFDGKSKQKIDDLVKLIRALPKDKGSRTSVNLSFLDMMNPVFQGKEMLRYALYRGGDKAMKDYFIKAIPTLNAIESSSNKTKNKISSSVSTFFKISGTGVTLGTLEMLSDKDLDKARESYELAQTNPGELLDKFAAKNKALMEAAPETANALQQRMIAGVQFLQTKVPHIDQEYIGEKIEPSRSEVIRFNDFVEAVEKPQIIYDQLKEGYLNPNTLEAVRTVYPKIYASIQAEMMAKLPKTLTRAQKIQLQPILGAKVTPAMDYKNLMRLQGKTQESAVANAQAQQQINHVPMGAAKNIKASSRSQTGLDKTLNRT
jgi:hypothetical protein